MRTSLFLLIVFYLPFLLSACDVSTGADSYLESQPNQSGSNYRSMAYQDAVDAGINPTYFVAQINEESSFNPNAVSRAGAIGIAQIMKATADEWGINPWDPIASLQAASQHMAWYVNTYGSYDKALACYNAGCSTLLYAESHCLDFYWCLPPQTEHYITAVTGDI